MANEQTIDAGKKKTSLSSFVTETRREIGKVSWPTRREVGMTTLMIVILAVVAGVFFLGVDSVLGTIVSKILGMNE